MSDHVAEAAGKFKRLSINDLAFRREVRAILRLGERAVAELLVEIDTDPHDITGKLARYAAIDPAALRRFGGDGFPPAVFRVPDSVLRHTLPPADGGDAA